MQEKSVAIHKTEKWSYNKSRKNVIFSLLTIVAVTSLLTIISDSLGLIAEAFYKGRLLAAIIYFSLYAFLNYFIGLKGWKYLIWSRNKATSTTYWVIFWLVAQADFVATLLGNVLPQKLHTFFILMGGYWQFSIVYILISMLAICFAKLISKGLKFVPPDYFNRIKVRRIIFSGVIVFTATSLAYGTWNARSIKIVEYDISIAKNAGSLDKLRIVAVSDIHLGDIIREDGLSRLVDKINQNSPDIVLFPGDIIDNDASILQVDEISTAFRKIKSKYGVYGVLGNHEYYSGKTDEVIDILQKDGIDILKDEWVKIEDSFYVVGRDDLSTADFGGQRQSLQNLINPLDKDLPIIVLDHQPFNLDEGAKSGIDLQISGHTHRGQILPARLFTNYIYETDWGYLKKNNTNIIVSSGFGTWGAPVRSGSHSEIVVINMKLK